MARGTWRPLGPEARESADMAKGSALTLVVADLCTSLPLLPAVSTAPRRAPSECTHDEASKQRQPFAAPRAPLSALPLSQERQQAPCQVERSLDDAR
ncbi:hypothetical protein PAHAL_9G246400 [Panicum hallii]|uniref:Uncharacterized protein n=1 Tax=Panicum hallii TaxID=206008 RepID=A0A2T8I2E9_9POAL|nr:hypothetical protein PAHAL_9G246400 [Panicum hallii]